MRVLLLHQARQLVRHGRFKPLASHRCTSPRGINIDSNMPSYRFLYERRRIRDARSEDALQLTGSDAPPEGWEVVPSFDAKCLVAYLMALNQSHPVNEVRSVGGAPAAPAPAAGSPAPASPAPAK